MFNRNNYKKETPITAAIGRGGKDSSASEMSEKQRESVSAKSQAWELFLKEQAANDMEMDMSPLGSLEEADAEQIPMETNVPVEESSEPIALESSEKATTSSMPSLPVPDRETPVPGKASPRKKAHLPAIQVKKNKGNVDETKGQRTPEDKNKRVFLTCIVFFVVIVACSAFFVHWRLAADRAAIDAIVEQRLAELSTANTASLEDINTRLTKIEGQMTDIEDILQITDKSISSSSSANREAMAKQIQELDKQMAKLKESINLLLESKAK